MADYEGSEQKFDTPYSGGDYATDFASIDATVHDIGYTPGGGDTIRTVPKLVRSLP